jgi:cytochrome c oxidase subunit 2
VTRSAIALHTALLVVFAGAGLHQFVIQSLARETPTNEQTVRISASSFDFKPSQITLKKGVPVIFELTSQDRRHGFNLPDFHMRADVQPGTVEKLRFVPLKVGTFTFLCDVFCGDRHEEMSGTIRVVE